MGEGAEFCLGRTVCVRPDGPGWAVQQLQPRVLRRGQWAQTGRGSGDGTCG